MDPYFQSDDIKLTDFLRGLKIYTLYVLKRIYIVVIAGVIMFYAGRGFAYISKKMWVANVSFNAYDSKSGGFGSLMSFASSFMGVGGETSNDVLMGVFSSRNVVKKSMLEEVDIDGKKDKIINFYLESFGYMDEFRETPGMENFKFTAPDVFLLSPREDTIMALVYDDFIDDYLELEFDPLAGLIRAGVFTPEKMLSQKLAEAMIKNTQRYYVMNANQKAYDGYVKLTKRVDSISSAITYYNTLLATVRDQNVFNKKEEGILDISLIEREMTVLTIQYNDAVSALDAAKTALDSEPQTIRLVDIPAFSTELDERDPVFWGWIGLGVGLGMSILILCLVKASKDAFEEERIELETKNNSTSLS